MTVADTLDAQKRPADTVPVPNIARNYELKQSSMGIFLVKLLDEIADRFFKYFLTLQVGFLRTLVAA